MRTVDRVDLLLAYNSTVAAAVPSVAGEEVISKVVAVDAGEAWEAAEVESSAEVVVGVARPVGEEAVVVKVALTDLWTTRDRVKAAEEEIMGWTGLQMRVV